MHKARLVVFVTLFSSSLAAAQPRRSLSDGLTVAEAEQITAALVELEALHRSAAPHLTRLATQPLVAGNARFRRLSAEAAKVHGEIGVYLVSIRQCLRARDPLLNAFEVRLAAELDGYRQRLKALRPTRGPTRGIDASLAELNHVAELLTLSYLKLDAVYEKAVLDVDPAELSIFGAHTTTSPLFARVR